MQLPCNAEHVTIWKRTAHNSDNAGAMHLQIILLCKRTATAAFNKSKTSTHSGLTPHKVRSSHDELNAADICKPLRDDVETGMKESDGISCTSRATEPLNPGCSLQTSF